MEAPFLIPGSTPYNEKITLMASEEAATGLLETCLCTVSGTHSRKLLPEIMHFSPTKKRLAVTLPLARIDSVYEWMQVLVCTQPSPPRPPEK